MKTRQWIRKMVVGIWAIAAIGCGHDPPSIGSLNDIRRTSAGETHIAISELAAEDMAALSKFQNLYEIDFGRSATDRQMEALAAIDLPRLNQVVLTGSTQVTDKGVVSLARVKTLQGLGLRGTGVGDESCRVVARNMRLKGIDVSRSPNITSNGLLALARSETIEELGFSLHDLRQSDLLRIIHVARKINHLEIEINDNADPRLNLPELRNAASAKGIELLGVRNQYVSEL